MSATRTKRSLHIVETRQFTSRVLPCFFADDRALAVLCQRPLFWSEIFNIDRKGRSL